jgi:putative salt-induced outer membrane protein YdiY
MKLKMMITLSCALLLAGMVKSSSADQVTMKNGDRLSGEIIQLQDQTLTVNTPYAGQITIQWDQVETVKTEGPVRVVLEDQTAARGILKTTPNGMLTLETDAVTTPLTFPLSRVEGINPPTEPPVKLSGRINAGLDVKKGNTDTEAYHADGEIQARTEKNRYTLGGELNKEEESGEETADNWLAYTSYDYFLSQKWYVYTNANFEADDFKDLNLRTTLGVGSGYQFFETPLQNLSVEAGLAYVNEDYSVDDQDDDYTAGRWGMAYDRYFFDKFFQFFHQHDGIVSLEDAEQIVIRTRTGLRIPLRDGFNTTVQYNWDWDNAPAPGNDRVDERYLFTLGYSWE